MELARIANEVNTEVGKTLVRAVWDQAAPLQRFGINHLNHFDTTDFITSFMLQFPMKCDWIMVTRGNSTYTDDWLDSVSPHIMNPKVDMIGWDSFRNVSHMPTSMKNIILKSETISSTVPVMALHKWRMNNAIIRANLYRESRITFLPAAILTKDISRREIFTLKSLFSYTKKSSVRYLY